MSKGLSGVFSSNTIQRHQFFGALPSLQSNSVCDHWEDHSLEYTDLCRQSDLSAFQHTVMTFLPKKQLSSDFIAAVTICGDFRAQEKEICSASTFSPSICIEVMGPDAMILVFFFFFFLIFSFKLAFTLFLHPHQDVPKFLFAFCH